jgi:polar amino acid transport system substrate-binding protein
MFATPHYCSGGVIISKDSAIRSADSLRDKVVAVQAGSSYYEKVKNVPGVKEVKGFAHDAEAIAALASGRVDAWVSDFFVVKTAMENNPGVGMKMGRFLFIEKIAAAIKKGNLTLAAAYDKALAELMADGTYKNLSDKYFKSDIRCL